MPHSIRIGTLAIEFPIGKTLAVSVAILLAIAALCETTARSGIFQYYLATPMVSGQSQIGAKLELLDAVEQQDGQINCFIIGSSVVLRGIDPKSVTQVYTERSGQQITCFNFGLSGLNIRGTQRLLQVLTSTYHPRLVIYGISFRDFVEDTGTDLNIPWARYQTGSPSLQGWMETQSTAYRYVLGYDDLLKPSGAPTKPEPYSKYGYVPSDAVMDVSTVPDRKSMEIQYEAWANYMISAGARRDMRLMLTHLDHNTVFVLVEMPVPETTVSILSHGRQDYHKFTEFVATEAHDHHVPFWQTLDANLVPTDGWQDYVHMNSTGAAAFSQWVGQKLASSASLP